MDDMWHTSGGLFEASCVFIIVGVGFGFSVVVGSMGSRCFDFADFAWGEMLDLFCSRI